MRIIYLIRFICYLFHPLFTELEKTIAALRERLTARQRESADIKAQYKLQ